MAEPFVGEIRMFGGNFAPVGWAACDGALLAISQNEVLFQLIGTTYGGDGQSTFALPDLRGRIPIHQGNGHTLGEHGGTEEVTLQITQIPSHSHSLIGSTASAVSRNPAGNVPSHTTRAIYGAASGVTGSQVAMGSGSVQPTGGNLPHDNVQPFLCVTFIISLFGIFPTQN
jgi:microcystin-dependent protein